jgi:threonine/homoserine/homoserine lactone efflux protein
VTELPLASYIPAAFALAITPGATTAVVVRNAIDGQWRAGAAAALGAALSNSTYATASGLGVAILLARYPGVLSIIRVAGAIYLAWLGLSSLRRAVRGSASLASRVSNGAATGTDEWTGFREGVAVNLVNPATLTFYVAAVPTYLPAGSGLGAFAILAGLHVLIALCCHLGWAFAFDRLRHAFSTPTPQRVLDLAAAGALFWLAARMVL